MIKNYFISSVRNIVRNKFFTLINVVGLSVGIATSILIFLYIKYETSYDKDELRYNQIYRVVSDTQHENRLESEAITPNPLVPALRLELTLPEAMTRTIFWEEVVLSFDNKKFRFKNTLFVEPQFFNVFNVDWLVGSPEVFNAPDVAVFTESAAYKLFGTIDVVNKQVKLNGKTNFTIKGIVKDNRLTNLPYSILFSYEGYPKLNMPFNIDSWGTTISGFQTFMVLKSQNDKVEVENQINEVVRKNAPERDSKKNYCLQPLADVHTNAKYGHSNVNGYTNPTYLLIAVIVGFFVLVLGCINYVNLSLSILIRRYKEIGVRKVNGAYTKDIINQFTVESILILIFSFVMAVVIAELILPSLSNLLEGQMYSSIYKIPTMYVFMLILLIILIVITGVLPSLKISSIKAIEVFRKDKDVIGRQKYSLRNLLIVIQFSVSIILIASTFIVYNQIKYLNSKELGYSTQNIINCPISSNKRELLDNLKNQIERIEGVEQVCFSFGAPTSDANAQMAFQSPFKKDGEQSLIKLKCIDYNYSSTFNIKVVAGKWWSSEVRNDSINEFLVNETFINKMNFPSVDKSIGEVINVAGNKGVIIGVLKDFHSSSLHNSFDPMVFAQVRQLYYTMSVKLNPNSLQETIKKIEAVWQIAFPDDIWEYKFFEDYVREQYKNDDRTFKLALIAAWIAISIALLGLFGISGYSIQQKTKTICIRKIMGAEVSSLIIYLSRRFVMLVLIANLIGLPIAYVAISKWLNQFAFHVSVGWLYFAMTLIISVALSVLIISYYAIKTANQNPSIVLRNE